MRDLFEICGECRHLSDAEVVYQMTNSKETSNQVNAMLAEDCVDSPRCVPLSHPKIRLKQNLIWIYELIPC